LIKEAGADPHLAFRLVELAGALRKLEQNDLDEVASTRLLIYAAHMIGSGMNVLDVCRCCLAKPLSDEPQTVNALMGVAKIYFDE
jgi:nitric oxide reductase NorQ protein